MLKSVIFDMDGVLIDSEPIYFRLQREFFAELGIILAPGEDNSFVGWSDESMWTHLKARFPHVTRPIEELSAISRARFKAHLLNNPQDARPVEGVVELLAALQKAGITLAVASSSAPDNIKMIIDTLGLARYFAHLVSGTQVPRGKPAPDVFLKAASLTGANPCECVVVEDSCNGVKAAKAAEIACVAYRNPGSGEQDLSQADLLIGSFSELTVPVLQELAGGKPQ